MKAVVLAGGKGARLAPYTKILPKPLMPIGDMPILEVLLRQMKRAGIDEVIITVGHLAKLLCAFFQDGEQLGLNIHYSYEDHPLGTAGPLSLVEDLEDTFLVANGDVLTTLNPKSGRLSPQQGGDCHNRFACPPCTHRFRCNPHEFKQ
jgi:NDP-sugar pyrophosphorylase family protein